MKIELKINGKNFKDTTVFNVLYTLLCLVRVVLIVCICFIPMIITFVVFSLLGLNVNKMFDKWVGLFDYLAFNTY